MHVIVDLCVVPLGVGVSVSKYVAACGGEKLGRCVTRFTDGTELESPQPTRTADFCAETCEFQVTLQSVVSCQFVEEHRVLPFEP